MIFHPKQTQLTIFLLLFVCVCDYVAVTLTQFGVRFTKQEEC